VGGGWVGGGGGGGGGGMLVCMCEAYRKCPRCKMVCVCIFSCVCVGVCVCLCVCQCHDGVAAISRLLKIISLFCRICSLL